jgi:Tfp pilus assembly protein PilF
MMPCFGQPGTMTMKTYLLVFLLIFPILVFAGDNNWTEVKSPHFTVLGDGPDEQARSIALSFEQARAIFTDALHGMRTEAETPTIVFAARDSKTTQALVGTPLNMSWGNTLVLPAALYLKGEEQDYALVDMDLHHTEAVATHEYIHKLLYLNFTRLPVWLDEGLAEFFAYSKSEGHSITLGARSERVDHAQHRFYAVENMLKATRDSECYRDPTQYETFYAESWALVHYLMFGPGMEKGAKLNKFLDLLQHGVEQRVAFEQSFGNIKTFSDQFNRYIAQKTLPVGVIEVSIDITRTPLVTTKLTAAQARIYLAALELRQRQFKEAYKKLNSALQEEPKNWFGHEVLGFAYFGQGNIDGAQNEWNAALELNPKDYLSLYYRGLLNYRSAQTADSFVRFKQILDDVIAINPNFTPAYVARSRVLVDIGDLNGAAISARKAANLKPNLAGYFLNYAEILMLQRKYPEALQMARFVANRWEGPNVGEALDLITRIRAAGKLNVTDEEKMQERDLLNEYAEDTVPIRGEFKAINCSNSKINSFVVASQGRDFSFRLKQGTYGHSDTIGITSDHFNLCYHANGYPVVVRAKAAPLGAITDASTVEIRNFLLPGEVE